MANHTKKTFKSESWVAHLNILFARCVGVGFAIVPLCYKENSDAKQWHTLDRVADERKTREIFGKVSFNGRRVYKWRLQSQYPKEGKFNWRLHAIIHRLENCIQSNRRLERFRLLAKDCRLITPMKKPKAQRTECQIGVQ